MSKTGIHPTYNEGVKVVCICGAEHEVNAAVAGPVRIESCPKCHPLYTGKKESKVIKGRMEKFLEKQKRMDKMKKKDA